MSWLTDEEAIRTAFEYRWRGNRSTEPILLTDFNIHNLRVVEVLPGAWDDVTTWRARERPMTDTEFSAINDYIGQTRGLIVPGNEVMQEQGNPVRVRGYIKRTDGRGWNATVDIDKVRKRVNEDQAGGTAD